MFGNTFGTIFRVSTYGESHGPSIGGIIDGCPSGLKLSLPRIKQRLLQRSPRYDIHGTISTPRKEDDNILFHSGVRPLNEEYIETLGTPISFSVANNNIRNQDYRLDILRPGHADYTYYKKYNISGISGGGRASGRETVSRVIAGAIAEHILECHNIHVYAGTESLHGIFCEEFDYQGASERPFYSLDPSVIPTWHNIVKEVKAEGDSIGGTVRIIANGVPVGLGEPVFDKLDARLCYALMSVGAIKGVEIGDGFSICNQKGSITNDPLDIEDPRNSAGGILGGISNGKPLCMRVAVKPIPSIKKTQTVKTLAEEDIEYSISGRHDISAIPRIVPVLSSMVMLTLVDFLLLHNARKLS